MRDVRCIICDTTAFEEELYPSNVVEDDLNTAVFSARRMPDRLHGRVVRCRRCSLVYTNPQVDTARLSKLYERSTYTYEGEERYIRCTYKRELSRVLPLLQRSGTAPPRISYLDIGCGNGFMLGAATELGFDDPWGVEPSAHAIRHLHQTMKGRIIQGMFSLALLGEKRFDVISCFQTLDHIPEPGTFVREVFHALRPGGAVLFINHNIASLTARILKERCPMIDIEHTFLHTPSTMRALFEKNGFMDIRVHAVRNDYPIHYWVHLLPSPRNIKRPIVDFLKHSAIGRAVIPLYAGNLGLIARKPR